MAKSDKKNGGRGGTVVIRREEVVEGGHHGGAWKVAYADFVTAMMAFFLLMWLLNATTEEQRKGLADYFSPTNVLSHGSSGSGQPFGGHTPFDQGTMVSDRGAVQVTVGSRPVAEDPDEEDESDTFAAPVHKKLDPGQVAGSAAGTGPAEAGGEGGGGIRQGAAGSGTAGVTAMTAASAQAADASGQQAKAANRPVHTEQPPAPDAAADQEKRERQALDQAARQIKEAVRADPALADIAHQLAIDMTPEGLRIQILDEDHQPMFATGSAAPNDRARLLLQKVAPVLLTLKEDISIAGHTDSTPFRGPDRTNWELSTERANGTRRLLVEAGLPQARIRSVTGNADRDPLLPADPTAAANRRIAIVVLRSVTPAAAPAPPAADEPPSEPGRASKAQAAPSSPP